MIKTAKSTISDLNMATDLRMALSNSKEFNESDKKEILTEIRYLEGYIFPNNSCIYDWCTDTAPSLAHTRSQ